MTDKLRLLEVGINGPGLLSGETALTIGRPRVLQMPMNNPMGDFYEKIWSIKPERANAYAYGDDGINDVAKTKQLSQLCATTNRLYAELTELAEVQDVCNVNPELLVQNRIVAVQYYLVE
ncbi:hypothetical protein HOC01_03790 [archaeon]|jgi:hypothetical protein|nr:hypothetical protein [archaeon]MBT6698466.1 hypothetical protein [archaeon]